MYKQSLNATHLLDGVHTWNVTFIGDYATITTTVTAKYDDAIKVAEILLQSHYGFSLDDWRAEFELAEWGEQ